MTRLSNKRPASPKRALAIAAAFVAGLSITPALAQTAEDLRRDAQACELPTGYLQALVPAAQARVEAINAQRRQVYQTQAATEGVEVEAVAAVYAMELRSQPNYRAC